MHITKALIIFYLAVRVFINTGIAQNSSSGEVIKAIPEGGVLLDKGWSYYIGDSAEFSNTEYSDHHWQPVNPALDIFQLPYFGKGIVWLRLHIFLDSAVRSQQLALSVVQTGVSEIYLNGQLVHRFGEF